MNRLGLFFLCAGFGSRLRPLTETLPKPLIPFLGKSALWRNVHQTRQQLMQITGLSIHNQICNTHHLPAQVEQAAAALDLTPLQEKTLLGTGGCLANAEKFLEMNDHFLVHNADLIHSIDLAEVVHSHLHTDALATLVGIDHPSKNSLCIDSRGNLLGVHGFSSNDLRPTRKRLTFSGIALYQSKFLRFCKPGRHDVKPFWQLALDAGEAVRVFDASASPWFDFGEPSDLWETTRWMLEKAPGKCYQYASTQSSSFVANETAHQLPAGLRNCVVFPGGEGRVQARASNTIFGRTFAWNILSHT